jgi:hypothetical protein
MLPLYVARIEALWRSDLVKIDCVGCRYLALLTPRTFCGARAEPPGQVLALEERVRCRPGRTVVLAEGLAGLGQL